MKKYVCLVLALMLVLLAGCSGGEESPQETVPVTEGLYDKDYPLEQQTSGAVRAYPLDITGYTDAYMMGNKLLLMTPEGSAIVLYGEQGEVIAAGTVEGYRPGNAAFAVGAEGIANYLPDTREVILINPQLQVTNRITLPEDIQGEPVISLERNEIFFCRDGEIRALDMESGVARLIKSHIVAEQTLDGCFYDGQLIRCVVKTQDDQQRVLYISALDGKTVAEDGNIYSFDTVGDAHFVRRTDCWVDQVIVGTYGGESQLLSLPEGTADYVGSALAMNGAVSYQLTSDSVSFCFYDLASGLPTARVKLPGITEPVAFTADKSCVWILVEEKPTEGQTEGRQVVLRWDVSKSAVTEETSVLGVLYTAEAPDKDSLKLCKEQASALNDTYGVRISVWDDAVKNTGDYTAVAEYQPAILTEMMEKLEPALQPYPESFLRKTVKSGWVRICLVRSIASGEPWVQFWSKGDCYLLLSTDADMERAFLEAMAYAVDSRVLGNSRKYDDWSELNPENFTYTAEAEGETQDVTAYLSGDQQAFVNMESVASAMEDRRQLFMTAMTQGNEAVFSSSAMQAKLQRMCEAIREAFDMQNRKEIFTWEQYLNEPLVQIEQTNG